MIAGCRRLGPLVGLDVRLALLTFEAVVFVAQALVLDLQLAYGCVQVFDQVEQLRNGAPRPGQVLDAVEIQLCQHLQWGLHGRLTGRQRRGCFSHGCNLPHSAHLVYEHRS